MVKCVRIYSMGIMNTRFLTLSIFIDRVSFSINSHFYILENKYKKLIKVILENSENITTKKLVENKVCFRYLTFL